MKQTRLKALVSLLLAAVMAFPSSAVTSILCAGTALAEEDGFYDDFYTDYSAEQDFQSQTMDVFEETQNDYSDISFSSSTDLENEADQNFMYDAIDSVDDIFESVENDFYSDLYYDDQVYEDQSYEDAYPEDWLFEDVFAEDDSDETLNDDEVNATVELYLTDTVFTDDLQYALDLSGKSDAKTIHINAYGANYKDTSVSLNFCNDDEDAESSSIKFYGSNDDSGTVSVTTEDYRDLEMTYSDQDLAGAPVSLSFVLPQDDVISADLTLFISEDTVVEAVSEDAETLAGMTITADVPDVDWFSDDSEEDAWAAEAETEDYQYPDDNDEDDLFTMEIEDDDSFEYESVASDIPYDEEENDSQESNDDELFVVETDPDEEDDDDDEGFIVMFNAGTTSDVPETEEEKTAAADVADDETETEEKAAETEAETVEAETEAAETETAEKEINDSPVQVLDAAGQPEYLDVTTQSYNIYLYYPDAENDNSTLPDSISISWYDDDSTTKSAAAQKQSGSESYSGKIYWTYSSEELPVLEPGDQYSLTITASGFEYCDFTYSIVVSGVGQYCLYITATPITSISGEIIWNDGDDYEARPDYVTVKLYADGEETKSAYVSESTGWMYSFTNLDMTIEYTVDADPVDGYDIDVNDYNITFTPDDANDSTTVVSISGQITWNDEDNQDGLRPDSVMVTLLANEKSVGYAELTEENNWRYKFEDYPKYENGEEIEYTVEAESIDGYTTSSDPTDNGFDINYMHSPSMIDISVRKIWDDGDNQDDIRPGNVVVRLYADGDEKTGQTLKEENGWEFTFENLAEFSDGSEIEYTILEDKVDGYTPEYDGSKYDGFTITNFHEPETPETDPSSQFYSIDHEIVTDSNDAGTWGKETTLDGFGQVMLEMSTYIPSLDADDLFNGNYSMTFYNIMSDGLTLDETDSDFSVYVGGSAISSDYYKITFSQDSEDDDACAFYLDIDLTQLYLDGVISEDDLDGDTEIIIYFYADAEYTGEDVSSYSSTVWYDVYDNDELKFSSNEDVVTITVEAQSETSVTVLKLWDDDDQEELRPEDVTINLLADGEIVDSMILSEENDWYGEFSELERYQDDELIVYTVEEVPVDGYDISITGDSDDGYVITNSIAEEPELIDIEGKKIWYDDDDWEGIRPEEIVISLFADGEEVDAVTVSEDDDWEWVFEDMPRYKDAQVEEDQDDDYTDEEELDDEYLSEEEAYETTSQDRIEIVYTIEEMPVDGYESSVMGDSEEGFVVTNTILEEEPELIDIDGEKIWDDDDDLAGIRPESITVILYADGEEIDAMTVTADDDWEWYFEDLPRYEEYYDFDDDDDYFYDDDYDDDYDEDDDYDFDFDDYDEDDYYDYDDDDYDYEYGEIVYTVSEVPVDGYESTVYGDAESGFEIVNTIVGYEPEYIDIDVQKVWNDDDDLVGLRPTEIMISLFADGDEIEEAVVTEEDGWFYIFEDLPRYDDYDEIVYTVEEEYVDGYACYITGNAESGYTITNTITNEDEDEDEYLIDITGQKYWYDDDNLYGIRPSSITIRLYANGTALESRTVSAATDWAWIFEDLPEYDNGSYINYTISEDAVNGYTVEYDDYDVLNYITEEGIAYAEDYGYYDGGTTDDPLYADYADYADYYEDPAVASAVYDDLIAAEEEAANLDDLLKGDYTTPQTGDDFNPIPMVIAIIVVVVLCGCGIFFYKKKGKSA